MQENQTEGALFPLTFKLNHIIVYLDQEKRSKIPLNLQGRWKRKFQYSSTYYQQWEDRAYSAGIAPNNIGCALIAATLFTASPLVLSAQYQAADGDSVKVAFVADQGTGRDAKAVLEMIEHENTDLVLIQGDFAYSSSGAADWEQNLNDALGRDFPVLSVADIKTRVQRADGLDCSGEPGIKASCNFQNIDIVQVAPGLHNFGRSESSADYARFIDQSFSTATSNWRICSWHMNQRRMQTGNKEDATGWEVFDACLDAGAMVAMGHEHAYSRTYLLSDFENQTVVHTRDDMTLKRGQSIAFVSGLGGWEVREQVRYDDDWFASIYTATQGATHGALFCNFGTSTADCYFKAIDGTVQDTFTLRRGQSEPQTQDRVPST